MDFISEFFYDVISKVIPGLIFFLFWTSIPQFVFDHKDFPELIIPLLFMLAWLVGTLVECLSYVIFRWILFPTSKGIYWSVQSLASPRILRSRYVLYWSNKLNATEFFKNPVLKYEDCKKLQEEGPYHRQIQKQNAEGGMFRSLTLISLYAGISLPKLNFHGVNFYLSASNRWYYFAAACIFFIVYVRWHFLLRNLVNILSKNAP